MLSVCGDGNEKLKTRSQIKCHSGRSHIFDDCWPSDMPIYQHLKSLNFYRPDAPPDTQPAMWKDWRQAVNIFGLGTLFGRIWMEYSTYCLGRKWIWDEYWVWPEYLVRKWLDPVICCTQDAVLLTYQIGFDLYAGCGGSVAEWLACWTQAQ